MNLPLVMFGLFATLAIVGSLLVVFRSNPVSSAFHLVLVFFSFAGLYALLSAHLIAALQILVYTGAIMVLFVFVIMLLNADQPVQDLKQSNYLFKGLSALGVASLIALCIRTVWSAKDLPATGEWTAEKLQEQGGHMKVISEAIFTDKVFHFELTSFLLLSAVISAITLAKRFPTKGAQS